MTSQLTELAYSFFANNSENIGPIWRYCFFAVSDRYLVGGLIGITTFT